MEKDLLEDISKTVQKFLDETKDREIQIISHFDTDGITSAAIMVQALKNIDRKFTLKIVKSLNEDFLNTLPKNKITLFLDLGSGNLDQINEIDNVFIIDHHEISREVPTEINIINSELYPKKQKISASGLTYLFCKEIDPENKKFAKLAVLGMVGDCLEKEIDKLNNGIVKDSEVQKRRGLLVFPATRPLNKALEFSSNPYIPGITGDVPGILELLREAGLSPKKGRYKSILELTEKEMQKLITSIMLKNPLDKEDIVGDIFLIKQFNQIEDARELSSKINACSRYGRSDIALKFCMETTNSKKEVESIHSKYKQELISSLKYAKQTEKIQGQGYVIINGQDNIKDTMAGTVASILSYSNVYEKDTVITVLALDETKKRFKVSTRKTGKNNRNVREILDSVVSITGGNVGGHEAAAGCNIKKEKQEEFLKHLKKHLEIEKIKIK